MQVRSKWLLNQQGQPSSGHNPDSIDVYLKELLVSEREVNHAGGVLQYWENLATTHPHLARMALDFLSAPGKLNAWAPILFAYLCVSIIC